MKKLMPLLDKNNKTPKPNTPLSKSFIRPSKSEVFLVRAHKKSTSPDTKRPQVSKNDQRITIYTDPTGFIVEYSTLAIGLKCDCYVTESSSKKAVKGIKLQSIQPRLSMTKIKARLEITLNKHHITTIKNGVQHIFSLPQESKQNLLKVVLSQNWEIQQFTIPNKKTKISELQSSKISENDIDLVYPLKNITEADELRKNKLIKSDSKLKIAWGNTQKGGDDLNSDLNRSQIILFGSQKSLGEMSQSTVIEGQKQFPRSAFMKKSWNQCDQTRDSQQDMIAEEKNGEKKVGNPQAKLAKFIHIDLSQWKTETIKESLKSPYRQSNFQYRILGEKANQPKFFK